LQIKTDFSEEEKRKLRLALSDTPFERYRSRNYKADSPEHIANR